MYLIQDKLVRFVPSHVKTDDVLPIWSASSSPIPHVTLHAILTFPSLIAPDVNRPNKPKPAVCLCFVFISPFSPKATAEGAATFIRVIQALW